MPVWPHPLQTSTCTTLRITSCIPTHTNHMWYRYIDDIFMIWDHGINELNKFIEHLNTSSENIKFTSEISGTELNFLDVKVKVENNYLTTDLYVKPTDCNTYLPYDLAHPRHCMGRLPYGQLQWI